MKIGVPKEIKTLEFRVGMTPAGVRELVRDGHEVIVETSAGEGIGMSNADYVAAGATVVDKAEDVFAAADMIVKVKEPQLHECAMLRPDQVLFTYLHLAADPCDALLVRRFLHGIKFASVQPNTLTFRTAINNYFIACGFSQSSTVNRTNSYRFPIHKDPYLTFRTSRLVLKIASCLPIFAMNTILLFLKPEHEESPWYLRMRVPTIHR